MHHAPPALLRFARLHTLLATQALATLLAGGSGCYHYRVSAPQVAALSDARSETKWSYFWGLVQESETDTGCLCMNNGLKEVTASTNAGYLLLSVVTLGAVVPTELEYVCGKPDPTGPWPTPPPNCPGQVDLPVPPDHAPAEPEPDEPDEGSF
jgi:Bor protein